MTGFSYLGDRVNANGGYEAAVPQELGGQSSRNVGSC